MSERARKRINAASRSSVHKQSEQRGAYECMRGASKSVSGHAVILPIDFRVILLEVGRVQLNFRRFHRKQSYHTIDPTMSGHCVEMTVVGVRAPNAVLAGNGCEFFPALTRKMIKLENLFWSSLK